ncbi:glyoxalase domain-containing protein 4-like [Clytia hemisphaerica]|uniref:glyoxalase domain-containing protein 4-like n=1 Tax=Clytia hemisphaerica TaxID=252671 RepID=UPI0034D550EC
MRRALHFVFKVADRKATIDFYRNVLGMKILRHEEFEKGCEAACNGPYDGKWSKTMVGYGAEDDHFVVELTYNYGIKSYKLGNDFLNIGITSNSVIDNAKKVGYEAEEMSDGKTLLEAPGGYQFVVCAGSKDGDPVCTCSLAVSDLQKSIEILVDRPFFNV